MRVMILMIPGVYQGQRGNDLPADFAPPADMVEKMMKLNEEMANAGVLLGLDGLQPLSRGARVDYSTGKPVVTDGPYVEAREVLGGYWLLEVGSREEAIEWARKIPAQPNDVVEVRPIFEMTDFPEDVQRAADNSVVQEAIKGAAR